MGRAKEKILAHKRAREEAKNVDKQRNSLTTNNNSHNNNGVTTERKLRSNKAAAVEDGDSIITPINNHHNPAKSGGSKKGSSYIKEISGNPNYGPIKPIWRTANSAHDLIEKMSQGQLDSNKTDSKILLTTPDLLNTDELKQLSDILPKFSLKQITPAVAAVALGRFDLLKKLVRDDTFEYDYSDKILTPMGCAIYLNNWEMINYLVEKGLNIHCKNKYETPLLVEAALTESWDVQHLSDLYQLVKDDPQLNLLSGNRHKTTICHVLAKKGWISILTQILPAEPLTRQSKKLLERILDATTTLGITPLMMAAENGHYETATYLIERGANFSQEDKFGCTAFCRALHYMYDQVPLKDGSKPDPIVIVLIDAMNNPACPLDVKSYITRRVQLMSNPSWDCHPNLGQVMYDLGRVPFFFYAAFIKNGVEELLHVRFMSRLVLGGQKYFNQTDYVVTICGIFFDFLVYTQQERAELYDLAVNNFINEGGADFCSKVMQKNVTLPLIDPTPARTSEGASICSTSLIPVTTEDDLDSLCGLHVLDDRNLSTAGMLPFIQAFDHPKIQNWLAVHFTTLKTAYTTYLQREDPVFMFKCNLMPSHCQRLQVNSWAWEELWSREYCVPFSDLIHQNMPSSPTKTVSSENVHKKPQHKATKKK